MHSELLALKENAATQSVFVSVIPSIVRSLPAIPVPANPNPPTATDAQLAVVVTGTPEKEMPEMPVALVHVPLLVSLLLLDMLQPRL